MTSTAKAAQRWHLTWMACVISSLSACSGGIGAGSTSGDGAVSEYTVSGSVSGLTGSGLTLDNNGSDDVTVSADGAFTFAIPLVPGDSYSITVRNQPTSPNQTCTVTNGSGTVTASNITGLTVTCATKTSPKDVIGGTVEGLLGSGLVLQNNLGDNLAVAADGGFAFATQLVGGATYSVSVLSPPLNPYQNCVVANGGGTVGANDVLNVAVTCESNPNPTFSISGTVSGLSAGSTLILQNNGRDDLPIKANGAFHFIVRIPSGSGYSVTSTGATGQQSQACAITNASGTVAGADVANVTVVCISNTNVTATVSGLAPGSTLVLQNNGSDDLTVTQNGPVTFQTAVPIGGAPYDVTILSEPVGYACAVANGVGAVTTAAIAGVAVSCSSIGGLLYVTNGGGNNISGFAIDFNTGTLQPLTQVVAAAGQPNAVVAATGTNPTSIVSGCGLGSPTFDPTLYIATPGSGAIAGFSVDTAFLATGTGALTAIAGSPVAAGNSPTHLDLYGSSCELYALDTGLGNISEFAADGAGVLTPSAGSPLAVGGTSMPAAAANATGYNGQTFQTFEYVANQVTNDVSAYLVDSAAGTLTPIITNPATGANTIPAGTKPSAIATYVFFDFVNPGYLDVPFVYVANQGDNTVSVYQGDPTSGVLTMLGTVATGSGPTAMIQAFDFLYVANGPPDNTISAYSIATVAPATPGTLTPIGAPIATGTNPVALAFANINGSNYLYVVNSQSNDVYVYSIDSTTGTPTFMAKFSVGSAPTSIAIPYILNVG